MNNLYRGKCVLVTGAAGTVGRQIISKLLKLEIKELKVVDNNESALFYINEEYRQEKRYKGFYADIRDLDRLKYLVKNVDIILHAAALKHVIISEINPIDAIKTNIDGTVNIIRAALESHQVSRVIYTSSDKAVNPTNVMGATKLLSERLITSAANMKTNRDIVFSSTRFGNVIGSNGSVATVFYQQIKKGQSITITDERMTRFFMTIDEAADLVLRASVLAKGGEVFVTKMPVMRIMDLAAAMVELLAPKFNRSAQDYDIEFIGAKPGEKLYEELMTEEESPRSYELQDMFMIKPAIPALYEPVDYDSFEGIINKNVTKPYISSTEPALTLDEVKNYVRTHQLLENLDN